MLSNLDLRDEGAAMATLQWSAVCGDLLRGLTHTLSNRIGFLTILSAHLSIDTSDIETSASMLRDECTKFSTVLRLIRLLPGPETRGTGQAQPISLAECMEDALSLLRHNQIGRETALAVSGTDGLPAVLGRQVELRRAMLTLLFAALRDVAKEGAGGEAVETIELACSASSDAVTLEIRTPPAGTEFRSAFWSTAGYFARAAGAELHPTESYGPMVLRIPAIATG